MSLSCLWSCGKLALEPGCSITGAASLGVVQDIPPVSTVATPLRLVGCRVLAVESRHVPQGELAGPEAPAVAGGLAVAERAGHASHGCSPLALCGLADHVAGGLGGGDLDGVVGLEVAQLDELGDVLAQGAQAELAGLSSRAHGLWRRGEQTEGAVEALRQSGLVLLVLGLAGLLLDGLTLGQGEAPVSRSRLFLQRAGLVQAHDGTNVPPGVPRLVVSAELASHFTLVPVEQLEQHHPRLPVADGRATGQAGVHPPDSAEVLLTLCLLVAQLDGLSLGLLLLLSLGELEAIHGSRDGLHSLALGHLLADLAKLAEAQGALDCGLESGVVGCGLHC